MSSSVDEVDKVRADRLASLAASASYAGGVHTLCHRQELSCSCSKGLSLTVLALHGQQLPWLLGAFKAAEQGPGLMEPFG